MSHEMFQASLSIRSV